MQKLSKQMEVEKNDEKNVYNGYSDDLPILRGKAVSDAKIKNNNRHIKFDGYITFVAEYFI